MDAYCWLQLDVSGECKTTYKISGPTIVKQKLKCENLEIAGQHSNENEVGTTNSKHEYLEFV